MKSCSLKLRQLMCLLPFVVASAQCLALAGEVVHPQTSGQFKYKQAESTGQNQWIYVNATLVPIRFDGQRSNKTALAAISALLPEVLGPNADGKITLIGSYDNRKIALPSGPGFPDPPGSFYYSFVLSHWYLKTPFSRLVLRSGSKIPQQFNSVRHQSLSANDFSNVDGFDPRQFAQPSGTKAQ